jgi:hypothetical protein
MKWNADWLKIESHVTVRDKHSSQKPSVFSVTSFPRLWHANVSSNLSEPTFQGLSISLRLLPGSWWMDFEVIDHLCWRLKGGFSDGRRSKQGTGQSKSWWPVARQGMGKTLKQTGRSCDLTCWVSFPAEWSAQSLVLREFDIKFVWIERAQHQGSNTWGPPWRHYFSLGVPRWMDSQDLSRSLRSKAVSNMLISRAQEKTAKNQRCPNQTKLCVRFQKSSGDIAKTSTQTSTNRRTHTEMPQYRHESLYYCRRQPNGSQITHQLSKIRAEATTRSMALSNWMLPSDDNQTVISSIESSQYARKIAQHFKHHRPENHIIHKTWKPYVDLENWWPTLSSIDLLIPNYSHGLQILNLWREKVD